MRTGGMDFEELSLGWWFRRARRGLNIEAQTMPSLLGVGANCMISPVPLHKLKRVCPTLDPQPPPPTNRALPNSRISPYSPATGLRCKPPKMACEHSLPAKSSAFLRILLFVRPVDVKSQKWILLSIAGSPMPEKLGAQRENSLNLDLILSLTLKPQMLFPGIYSFDV